MKSVMISIKPKWCELIANGKKTIEIRKTRPKIDTPFKCYIYCTNSGRPLVWGSPAPYYNVDEKLTQTYGYSREDAEKIFGCWNGKVIGWFVCDEIYNIDCDSIGFFYKEKKVYIKKELEYNSCLSEGDIFSYLFPNVGYGWHISELKIYDEPKELCEFSAIDNHAVKKCQNRIEIYYMLFDSECIKSDYYCERNNDRCIECKHKMISKPPTSWCYADELR